MGRREAWTRKLLESSPDPLQLPLRIDFRPEEASRYMERWRAWADSVRSGQVYPGLVLYIHIPFCARLCSFCSLAVRQAPGRSKLDRYADAVRREIELHAEILRDVEVSTIHVGGGTPSVLSAAALDAIFSDVRKHFTLRENLAFGVEMHPGSTTREKLDVLARHGVTRVSFGVQTLESDVISAVNRGDQTTQRVEAAIEMTRKAGLPSVNIDLLTGLPGQTVEGFEETVRQAVGLGTDSLTINRALAENSPLAMAGHLSASVDAMHSDELLMRADVLVRRLRPPLRPKHVRWRSAYGVNYLWEDSAATRDYFQEDMNGPASVLGLGFGAMSRVHGSAFGTARGEVDDYLDALEAHRAPGMLTAEISPGFERAIYASSQMTNGVLRDDDFSRIFGRSLRDTFGSELDYLVHRALVRSTSEGWQKVPNRSFDAMHLLVFLGTPATTLGRDLRSVLLEPNEVLPPYDTVLRDADVVLDLRLGDVAPDLCDGESGRVDVVDCGSLPVSEVAQRVATLRERGVQATALWTSPERLTEETEVARLVEAGVSVLMIQVVPGAGTDALARAIRSVATVGQVGTVPWATLATQTLEGALDVVAHVSEAGGTSLLLEVDDGLGVTDSATLLEFAGELGVGLETVRRPVHGRLSQYRELQAEFPPSLIWCRIGFRAFNANRQQGSDPLGWFTGRA